MTLKRHTLTCWWTHESCHRSTCFFSPSCYISSNFVCGFCWIHQTSPGQDVSDTLQSAIWNTGMCKAPSSSSRRAWVCRTAVVLCPTNTRIPINPILCNSHPHGNKTKWCVINCTRCIIEYIPDRSEFPFWLGVNENGIRHFQFSTSDEWKIFHRLASGTLHFRLCFSPLSTYFGSGGWESYDTVTDGIFHKGPNKVSRPHALRAADVGLPLTGARGPSSPLESEGLCDYSRSDSMWLPRLGHRKWYSFYLDLLGPSP